MARDLELAIVSSPRCAPPPPPNSFKPLKMLPQPALAPLPIPIPPAIVGMDMAILIHSAQIQARRRRMSAWSGVLLLWTSIVLLGNQSHRREDEVW